MTGEELEIRKPMAVAAPGLLTDDELRRMMRMAEAFHLSGIYKDVEKAQQALAKMIVGRDLGLGIAQSMQAVQFVEGAVQLHYSMIGAFIKRNGLDYRTNKHTETECELELLDGPNGSPYDPPKLSEFTIEHARKANLIKSSDKAAWKTVPRSMLFARAMSNLAKWHCPEVLGGIPVYVPGEMQPHAPATGEGDAPPKGLDLGPEVEQVIARAEKVGHAGLSDRATIELTLGGRSPAAVPAWVRASTAELDEWERAQAAGDDPPAEIADGEVVGDAS